MYWLTGVIGIALVVAPFVFNYSNNVAAMWVSVAAGAVAMLFAGFKIMGELKGA